MLHALHAINITSKSSNHIEILKVKTSIFKCYIILKFALTIVSVIDLKSFRETIAMIPFLLVPVYKSVVDFHT